MFVWKRFFLLIMMIFQLQVVQVSHLKLQFYTRPVKKQNKKLKTKKWDDETYF